MWIFKKMLKINRAVYQKNCTYDQVSDLVRGSL